MFFVQDLFHLLDANGGDTASQEELVKAGRCFFFSLPAEILLEWSLFFRNFIFSFLLLPKINQPKYLVELEKNPVGSLFDESISAFAEMDEDEDGEITQEEFIKVKVGRAN